MSDQWCPPNAGVFEGPGCRACGSEYKSKKAETDGPWSIDSDDPTYVIHPEKGGWDGLVIAQVADQDGALFPVEHNGALIAHAPQDLTDLLAEVERLREALDAALGTEEEA